MFDGFVQIEGIAGESSNEKHVDWIEIMDFDLDVSQSVSKTASSSGGGSAPSALIFQNFALPSCRAKHLPSWPWPVRPAHISIPS